MRHLPPDAAARAGAAAAIAEQPQGPLRLSGPVRASLLGVLGMQVREASWSEERDLISAIRHTVFVEEQKVPEDLELDAYDVDSHHVLAFDDRGRAIGTGRLVDGHRVGRMAVLAPWRNAGVGRAILDELVAIARREGAGQVVLHAQVHAVDFYARQGFEPVGPDFLEAGIEHQEMILRL